MSRMAVGRMSSGRRVLFLAVALAVLLFLGGGFYPRGVFNAGGRTIVLWMPRVEARPTADQVSPSDLARAIGGAALGRALERLGEAIRSGALVETIRELGRAYREAVERSVEAVGRARERGWDTR